MVFGQVFIECLGYQGSYNYVFSRRCFFDLAAEGGKAKHNKFVNESVCCSLALAPQAPNKTRGPNSTSGPL